MFVFSYVYYLIPSYFSIYFSPSLYLMFIFSIPLFTLLIQPSRLELLNIPTESLHRGKLFALQRVSLYDIKPSDDKTSTLEISWMWSNSSLQLLLGPSWPEAVAHDRILSMGQLEQSLFKQTLCKQATDVKLWLVYSNAWNHFIVWKKEPRLV